MNATLRASGLVLVLALVLGLLLWAGGAAWAGAIYVNAAATGANTGGSWTNAYTDLQAALATAQAGDEIWVAAGTYKPTSDTDRTKSFVMKTSVTLYGGFAGTETTREARDWQAHETILTGDIGQQGIAADNSYHVVVGSDRATLDGFTVTKGNTNDQNSNLYGGGMINDSVSPTIANCAFRDNTANGIAGFGGGMYNRNNSPMVTNCTFSGNTAHGSSGTKYWSYGGGMCNDGSSPTVTNCTFNDNKATAADNSCGGGMYNFKGSPTVTNCTFSGNTASNYGGGICNDISSPTITHCTFSGNTASDGGGIQNYHRDGSFQISTPTVINCIFSSNTASASGGGMYNSTISTTVINCTFSNNTAAGGGGMTNSGTSSTVTNCTFNNNTAGVNGGGMGNYSSLSMVTNCTFSGNKVSGFEVGGYRKDGYGGGMSNYDSGSTVTNCTFSGNTVTGLHGYGGGMYFNGIIWELDEVFASTVSNCTFYGNVARGDASYGGGIEFDDNVNNKDHFNIYWPTVTNCTFKGNTAGNYGGGMSSKDSWPKISNCVFEGDSATSAPEVFYYSTDRYLQVNPTFTHCDIQGSGGSGAQWNIGPRTDGGGNIMADPVFRDSLHPAGPDGLWGTADDGLALAKGSPCINAGTSNGAPLNDILGHSRAGLPDIGAYEYFFYNAAAHWVLYQ